MATPIRTFEKDDAEHLEYGINWSLDPDDPEAGDWLDGATIVTSTWSGTSGFTVTDQSNDDTQTLIWLSGGGDVGTVHDITNQITDSEGRIGERTIRIVMVDR